MSKPCFLITGGSGFIGSNLINEAHQMGFDISAIKRLGARPRIELIKEPKWKIGELDDNWVNDLKKCSAFIHLCSYGVADNSNNFMFQ